MPALLLLDRCRRTRREVYALLRERYRVFATHSIFAAFKELRRRQVDRIVVRTADGDAFAVALLKWLGLRHRLIPTVVVVGPGSSRDAGLARELGASAVLRAPAPAGRLRAAVASAVVPEALHTTRQAASPRRARGERVLQVVGLN